MRDCQVSHSSKCLERKRGLRRGNVKSRYLFSKFFRVVLSVITAKRKNKLNSTVPESAKLSFQRDSWSQGSYSNIWKNHVTFIAKIKKHVDKKSCKRYIDLRAFAHIFRNEDMFLSMNWVWLKKLLQLDTSHNWWFAEKVRFLRQLTVAEQD